MAFDLRKGFLTFIVLIATGYVVVSHSAAVLVVDDPVKSDAILLLAGGRDDTCRSSVILWGPRKSSSAPACIVSVSPPCYPSAMVASPQSRFRFTRTNPR